MEILLKKSHVYSCILFCVLNCAMLFACLARALSYRMPWVDVPAIVILMVLGSGLLCITFNYGWLFIRERVLKRGEEPQDYLLTNDTLYTAATLMLFASVLGMALG